VRKKEQQAITSVLLQVELDVGTISSFTKPGSGSGLGKQLSTLVVKFNFIFSISIVYGQTEY